MYKNLIQSMLAIAATTSLAVAAEKSPHTDWLMEARVGAFMHFLPDPGNGAAAVEAFDVKALADQLEAMGAKYFVFTLGQNSGWFNAPNATYDQVTGFKPGERCATRDLPADLQEALAAKGIRLMLYLPCQTPNRDVKAQKAFGLAQGPRDQPIDVEFAQRWAGVIQEWSERYGDKVSGWWFDGGYKRRVGFNDDIANVYANAVRKGNPKAIVTFNPGLEFIRHTEAEDYTAGEVITPFAVVPKSRWVNGSQWHVLTFLGKRWGSRETRLPTERWATWFKEVAANGGAVTFDMGPNLDPELGPVGTFSKEQADQFRKIAQQVEGMPNSDRASGKPKPDAASVVSEPTAAEDTVAMTRQTKPAQVRADQPTTPWLRSVSFGGQGHYEVELDGYGTCRKSHWVSSELEGGLAGANHPYVSPAMPAEYNQKSAPIAFVRGSTPTLSACFTAPDLSQAQAKVTGKVRAEFALGAGKPMVYQATLSGEAHHIDGMLVAKNLRCDKSLPDKIGLSEAFTITWMVADSDGQLHEAGTSSFSLYLLRQLPLKGCPLLHTPLKIACSTAAGLDADQAIIEAVWQPFADMHVTRARDDQQLQYYGTYQSTAGDLRGLLVLGSGQCTTWAFLMHAALGVHGIDSEINMIMASQKGGILVANWAFLEGAKFISSGPNGICETTAAGDDKQAIAVGSGRPNTRAVDATPADFPTNQLKGDDLIRGRSWGKYLLTGPDGIVQTVLDPEHFLPVVPLGFGVAQQRGYQITDPKAEIRVAGDDTLTRDAKGNGWVTTGPNGILETLPQEGMKSASQNRVTVSLGKGSAGLNLHTYLPRRRLAQWPRKTGGDDVAHDNSWISTGPNGIAETAALGSEKQVMQLGTGTPDVPVIGPGPDGVLDTKPAGDDTILDKIELLKLAGKDFPYLNGVNAWPLAGVPGQGTSNPPPGFPNHVILKVGQTLYDPSYGNGPFPDHATWEKASLAGISTDITDAEGKKVGGKVRREGKLSYMQRLLPPN